ncbi:phosphate-induced protein 1 [Artemisia annua]|uniref:Phosphate-induced protein 1 n=1 Tax=Artemisia annua TaxID=35608 RepID=A0A2U1K968_ARTAN|nr:phosphate-induced protein 1 [Artemisia annua]
MVYVSVMFVSSVSVSHVTPLVPVECQVLGSLEERSSSVLLNVVCGFHYFTFPSKVGSTLLYAWVGNSGKQYRQLCAYPFAVPGYMGGGRPGSFKPANGDVGIAGIISVIGRELAELASNPLVNAWYVGSVSIVPTEIRDLCEGLYGSGGGGGCIGNIMKDGSGQIFNMHGVNGRKFLVQSIWNPVFKACAGPNALD